MKEPYAYIQKDNATNWESLIFYKRPLPFKSLRISIYFMTILSLEGCSGLYFHDQQREVRAEKAYTEFKVIRENASVEKLVASYADQRVAENELVNFISILDDETQLSTLHDTTWMILKEQTDIELEETRNTIKNAETQKKKKELELADSLNKLPLIQKKATSLVESMNEAALTQARFEATQLLLKESLLLNLENDSVPNDVSIQERLDKLNNTNVLVTEFELKNSTLIENEPKPKSIKDLLGLGLPFNLVNAAASGTNNNFQEAAKTILKNILKKDNNSLVKVSLVFNDPGINLKVISLLQDFARAEEERIKVEINYARQIISFLEENISFLQEHQRYLTDDLNPDSLGIAGAFSVVKKRDDTVGITFAKFAKPCQQNLLKGESDDCRNLRSLYRVLAFNYQNRVSDSKKKNALASQLAGLDARLAIDTARVQVLEREAAITRGISGLLEFYQGGINENDIRNIIAIAQAIGVAVIAGGIY